MYRKHLPFGAYAVVFALMLTSCGSGGGDESAAGGQVQEEVTLEFAVQRPPNSLHPSELHDGEQRFVWGTLFDTLLHIDEAGELHPGAAEEWEYSDDALTLTLRLREDLSFSDGREVTAEDVKGTLDWTRNEPGPQAANLASIESVEAEDDRTVVISLSEPDGNLLNALSQAAGVIGDPESIENPQTQLNPVGTGPYTLNPDRTQDGVEYVLERRDDHWNVEEYPFTTVTVQAIQDATARYNALLAGQVDAATVNGELVEQAENAGLTVHPAEGATLAQLVLADRQGEVTPELADTRVRQAINLALDREGMLQALMYGYGSPTEQLFPPTGDAYLSEAEGAYEHDLEDARRLMEEAGYSDGFTLAMPATMVSMQFQAALSQAFSDIGIRLQWDPVQQQESGNSGQWSAYWNISGGAAPSRIVDYYFEPDATNNPFGTTDPELDELLEAAAAETEPDEVAALYREISQFGLDEAWFAPVMWIDTMWATTEGIEYTGGGLFPQDLKAFGVTG
ncbi:ABC transporter substrate-binding protein [Nesterenkonia rhizosphaerae]|uniref:ABC transporter substrate-binding protein n=1 Tax=Nesterenkonia rhizosphaerae TaxID=1348272 RepID=A0ABP9FVB2_9MICC